MLQIHIGFAQKPDPLMDTYHFSSLMDTCLWNDCRAFWWRGRTGSSRCTRRRTTARIPSCSSRHCAQVIGVLVQLRGLCQPRSQRTRHTRSNAMTDTRLFHHSVSRCRRGDVPQPGAVEQQGDGAGREQVRAPHQLQPQQRRSAGGRGPRDLPRSAQGYEPYPFAHFKII